MGNFLSNGTYMMALDAINRQLVEEEEEAAFKTRTISRKHPAYALLYISTFLP